MNETHNSNLETQDTHTCFGLMSLSLTCEKGDETELVVTVILGQPLFGAMPFSIESSRVVRIRRISDTYADGRQALLKFIVNTTFAVDLIEYGHDVVAYVGAQTANVTNVKIIRVRVVRFVLAEFR